MVPLARARYSNVWGSNLMRDPGIESSVKLSLRQEMNG